MWCFLELWSPIKARELVKQAIFSESIGFHVGNVVSADFFWVYGFKNVSVTTSKLFANDHQVVTLTYHNDVISCFTCWYKYISLGVLLNILFPRIPCLLDSKVFLRSN